MVRQRPHQRNRDGGGITRRFVALALALILGSACDGSARVPTGLGDRPEQPAQSQSPSRLIGVWRSGAVVDSTGFQTQTTTWQFNADRTCSLLTTSGFSAAGTPTTTQRGCTYADRGTTVAVTFTDNGAVVTIAYQFPDPDFTRLVLNGVEFQKVG